MFISKKDKILYDAENFDKYKNVYTVLIDNSIIKTNIDKIEDYDILNINIIQDIFLINFPPIDESLYNKNEFKIIYGHFYNNSDMFLYKNIHSGKIIAHSIKKTYIDKLYYNKNKLLYNRSYKILVDQLNKLQVKGQENFNARQPIVDYQYNNETIIFDEDSDKYVIPIYNDECLTLTYTNKTKIII